MIKHYKQAIILGAGASGQGAARLLLAEGSRVTVVDEKATPHLFEAAHSLEQDGGRVLLDCRDLPDDKFDVAVVSPGVSLESKWMETLRGRNIPCISELELGWSRCRGRVWAITGSNGKSTLVKWCSEALEKAGRSVRVAGNYGPSFAEQVRRNPAADEWVVEVSSFQLETVDCFKPDIAILLNLLPNHLDRHHTMQNYLELKSRIFARCRAGDICVLPDDLSESIDLPAGCSSSSFGIGDEAIFQLKEGHIMHEGECIIDFTGTLFENEILGLSAAALTAAFVKADLPVAALKESARTFKPLPHRMQRFAEMDGIQLINDSKATNLAAMAAALSMTDRPVRLIAGGMAKENNFERVKEILAERVQSTYLIGKSAEKMSSVWADTVPCNICGTLAAALRNAWADARAGEVILLSPGCASFDQFQNFADRGNRFMQLATSLTEEVKNG